MKTDNSETTEVRKLKARIKQLEAENRVLGKEFEIISQMFDTLPDACFLVNRETRTILRANQGAVKLFGVESKDFFKGNKELSFHKQRLKKSELKRILHHIKTCGYWESEYEYLRQNGQTFWGLFSLREIFIAKTQYLVMRVTDISRRKRYEEALKKSEAKFRTFVEQSHDAILISDASGVIKHHNEAMERLVGLSQDQLKGKKAQDLLFGMLPKEQQTPQTQQELDKKIQLFTQTAPDASRGKILEFEIVNHNGERRFIQERVFAFSTEQGRWVASIKRDITQQKLSEQEIKQQNQELEYAYLMLAEKNVEIEQQKDKLETLNATKDRFFTIIAHDLRSPFNNILGLVERLAKSHKQYDETTREHFIRMLYETTVQTYNLLENLLQWSRKQRNKLKFQPREIELRPLLEDLADLFSASAQSKNISLQVQHQDLPTVFADENMLNTIIRNLISNAIKFTHAGGTVKVWAQIQAHETQIFVSDTGIGLSPEQQKKLFQKKIQTSSKGTQNEAGTGLGLMLCHEFAEKMNAKLLVESTQGKGSTFLLKISKKNKNIG